MRPGNSTHKLTQNILQTNTQTETFFHLQTSTLIQLTGDNHIYRNVCAICGQYVLKHAIICVFTVFCVDRRIFLVSCFQLRVNFYPSLVLSLFLISFYRFLVCAALFWMSNTKSKHIVEGTTTTATIELNNYL